jgi:hypothetical protein
MQVHVWIGKSRIAGKGLFAGQDITKDTIITRYLGAKISKAQGDQALAHGNAYIGSLNDRYDIDGNTLKNTARYIPTVSPATNSLVYFISIASIDHPVWRSPREEAKRGPPSGHRITRNGAAMVSLLLPYATTGLSRIAGWCWSGATPRGPPRTPVLCPFRRPFMGRPVPRPFLRNAWLNLTTIVPTTASHRRSYAERYSRSIGKPCGT